MGMTNPLCESTGSSRKLIREGRGWQSTERASTFARGSIVSTIYELSMIYTKIENDKSG